MSNPIVVRRMRGSHADDTVQSCAVALDRSCIGNPRLDQRIELALAMQHDHDGFVRLPPRSKRLLRVTKEQIDQRERERPKREKPKPRPATRPRAVLARCFRRLRADYEARPLLMFEKTLLTC